jgi:hypothetical protein
VAVHVLGPTHPRLGIAMDMSIQLRKAAHCVLSLSLNNAGPFWSVFRHAVDTGTYATRHDDQVAGDGEPVNLSTPACRRTASRARTTTSCDRSSRAGAGVEPDRRAALIPRSCRSRRPAHGN